MSRATLVADQRPVPRLTEIALAIHVISTEIERDKSLRHGHDLSGHRHGCPRRMKMSTLNLDDAQAHLREIVAGL